MPISKKCHTCGKPISVTPCRVRERNFCSRECVYEYRRQADKWRKDQVELTCEQCEKQFVVSKQKSETQRFCSYECVWEANRTKVVVNCDNCGGGYEIHVSRLESYEHHFCSNECRFEFFKGRARPDAQVRVEVDCNWCGAVLERVPSSIKGRTFCGRGCHDAWQRENPRTGEENPAFNSVEVTCAHCLKKSWRPVSLVRGKENSFCDLDCYGSWLSQHNTGENHPSWNGGHIPHYGDNWREQRRKARRRDRHTCQHCGVTREEIGRALDVHHIIPFREFGVERYREANRLENLISLCRSCHVTEEGRVASK